MGKGWKLLGTWGCIVHEEADKLEWNVVLSHSWEDAMDPIAQQEKGVIKQILSWNSYLIPPVTRIALPATRHGVPGGLVLRGQPTQAPEPTESGSIPS